MKLVAGVLATLVFACGGDKKPAPKPSGGDMVINDPKVEAKPEDKPAAKPAAPKSLFDRLGGLPAITAVVEEFVARTTTDPRIQDRFFNTDATELKKLLVEFVCLATGGPCKYSGRTMVDSHAGMELVDEEFNALVEDLVAALDKFKVPAKEKGEILGALGPLKPDMVATPDKLKPIEAKKLADVTKLAGTAKDPAAKRLLEMAVVAGGRGQRSYAEQLFSRAEMLVGPATLKSVASTFRTGAPPAVTAATKKLTDAGAQPKSVGSSDTDSPDAKPARGSLKGTVKLDGAAPQGLSVVMMWPKTGGFAKRTPKQRVIEQRGKTFAPHVMAVPVGSTITFPNYDNIFHNVFSLSKTKAFDLGMYKNGEAREVKVDKPGIVRLGCNLHANMAAYLIVVDAPAYVVAEPSGEFSFRSLAPGKYRVQTWSERSGTPAESEVTIKEGGNEVVLDLKGGATQIGPDKFNKPRSK